MPDSTTVVQDAVNIEVTGSNPVLAVPQSLMGDLFKFKRRDGRVV